LIIDVAAGKAKHTLQMCADKTKKKVEKLQTMMANFMASKAVDPEQADEKSLMENA
jgi:hypothetical protein